MKEIITERLVLKPLCAEHLLSTHEYASDPETCRFMVYLPNASEEETMVFLREAESESHKEYPSYYEMGIFCGGVHIGAVSLYLSDDRTVGELGWILNKKYHGHGYACEAARAMIDRASDELGIKHFRAHCDTENIPSRRVMEKLGMTLREEHGGRKNRLSDEDRREYLFELIL